MAPRVMADSEALKHFRKNLLRTAGHLHDAIPSIEASVQAMLNELDLARSEKLRRMVQIEQLLAVHCRNLPWYYAPSASCWEWEQEVRSLERELDDIYRVQQAVLSALERYRVTSQHVTDSLQNHVPQATSFLERHIVALEAYQATQLLKMSASLATTGLSGMFGLLAFTLKHVDGKLKSIVGSMGEEIATQILNEKYGLEETPFDQPKHGFDRVFSAPGIPLVIVESKTSKSGELRLKDTLAGEQGQAEWLQDKASRMINRESAQWSPANERIGQLVREMGSHEIPVLAIVTNPESGIIDVYFRQNSGGWGLLEGGIVAGNHLSDE